MPHFDKNKLPETTDDWDMQVNEEHTVMLLGYLTVVPEYHKTIEEITRRTGDNAEEFKREILEMVQRQKAIVQYGELNLP